MIKDFLKISDADIKYIKSHPVSIYEKLDMIYFKVNVYHDVVIPVKTPMFNAISDVDRITNTIYRGIILWCNENIANIREDMHNRFGNVEIGFFYAPKKKTKVIEYNNINDGWICYSDCKAANESDKPALESFILSNIHEIHNARMIGDVFMDEELIRTIIEKEPTAACKTLIEGLGEGIRFPSGSDEYTAEGIIIRAGSKQWQIALNDTSPYINKDTKKIYRDLVLSSLSKELLIPSNIMENLSPEDNYITKVCRIFEDYMNVTDIFSKVKFDPEDLLPPIEGAIGDLDIEYLESYASPSTITICRYNETAKNILRLFLHTFTHSIHDGKFQNLTTFDQTQLNGLIKALNYRNYADIALRIMKK